MSKRQGQLRALEDGIEAARAERRAAIRTGSSIDSPFVRKIDAEIKLLRSLMKRSDRKGSRSKARC